jgi:hypothetical protein
MNVGIGSEAAQFPEKEYINGIFAVQCALFTPVAFFRPSYMERILSLPKTFSLSSPSLILPIFTYYQKSEIRINKPEYEKPYKSGNLLRTAKTP